MKTSNIINIVLVGLIMYLLLKPKPVSNPYYLREMKASIKRQDSLVNLINEIQKTKNELKDSIASIDSVYIDMSKDSLRARIGHLMLTNIHR